MTLTPLPCPIRRLCLQIWKEHVVNWSKNEILRAHPDKGRKVIQELNSRLARIGFEAGFPGQKAFSHGLFKVANP